MVHSQADYDAAVEASNILFGNSTSEQLHKLDEDTLLAVFEGVPQFEISRAPCWPVYRLSSSPPRWLPYSPRKAKCAN